MKKKNHTKMMSKSDEKSIKTSNPKKKKILKNIYDEKKKILSEKTLLKVIKKKLRKKSENQ